jgi:fructokinase
MAEVGMTSDRQSSAKKTGASKAFLDINSRPAVVARTGTSLAPDGVEFAGRSVLNVMRHLHALGFEPLLVTRIGNDAEGRQVLRQLEKSGVDTGGVQIDDSLPTSEKTTGRGFEGPSCAWEAFDWKPAVRAIDRIGPALLFHGVSATDAEPVRKALNTIQHRTAVPFFVDLDLADFALPTRTVRRTLLGVRWIRANAKHLQELIGESEASILQSVLNEALVVQARFALEGVVVEHRGLPTLVVSGDQIARGSRDTKRVGETPAQRRDAATAALIAGVVSGLPAHSLLKRTVDQALAFISASAGGRSGTSSNRWSDGSSPRVVREGANK